jgi:type II secretory pathway pseudopilin PulG
MRDRDAIVVGDKGRRRRPLGPVGRRVRALFVGFVAAGCVAWSLGEMDERTRIKQAQLDISRIEHAARLFRADFGRCPTNVQELRAPPGGAQRYVEEVDDPWGNAYRLLCPARLDPGGVDVSSDGPDGSLAGDDNIANL